MRTEDELILSLHARMARRRKKKEDRTTNALRALCVCFTVCLVPLVFGGAAHTGGTAGVYSGSAMLYESAGPYVLTALVAFMVGVTVTLLFMRLRKESTSHGMRTADDRPLYNDPDSLETIQGSPAAAKRTTGGNDDES